MHKNLAGRNSVSWNAPPRVELLLGRWEFAFCDLFFSILGRRPPSTLIILLGNALAARHYTLWTKGRAPCELRGSPLSSRGAFALLRGQCPTICYHVVVPSKILGQSTPFVTHLLSSMGSSQNELWMGLLHTLLAGMRSCWFGLFTLTVGIRISMFKRKCLLALPCKAGILCWESL